MTIFQRQYEKILAAETLRYLLLGKLPNLPEVASRIADALGTKSAITYKYIPQAYGEVFNNKLYNRSLKKIKFDIDLFHDELLALYAESTSRLSYADLYHKLNSYELKQLQSKLEMLLFTIGDADFYFSGAFDTFSDLSKTNTLESTREIVDLSEEALILPYLGKSTKRIDTGSLIPLQSIPIQVSLAENNTLVSNNQIPNSSFGNIFSNTLQVWGHEIVTTSNGKVNISFTFPLNNTQEIEAEYFVSRFEIIPHIAQKQRVTIETSNDNVNFLKITGYEGGVLTSDQKVTYALDFETTLVQYVRITLSKETADEEITTETNQKAYKYLFGLKRFAAYSTGRTSSGTYVSKPFTFPSLEVVGRVAMDVEDFVPPNCSVNYSIASSDSNGNLLSPYIPITPLGTSSNIGSRTVVSFGTTTPHRSRFSVPSTGTEAAQAYGTPFQGKQFYRIGPAIEDKPIFGTSSLFRGFRGWTRDVTGTFEVVSVTDNYVSFEHSDLESMYAITTEVPGISTYPAANGIRRASISLTKPPYYDSSRGHALKPQPATQNPLLDTRPNYAIYTVIRKGDTNRRTITFTLSPARTQYLPVDAFIIQSSQSSDLPRLRLVVGQQFVHGVDYTFEVVDIGGQSRPTGNLVIPEGSSLLTSAGTVQTYTVEFSYQPDPDITHKVSRISGNDVILDHALATTSDAIEVTYRFIPVTPSQIIKASIRVADLPSTSGSRTFYVEGRDYVVDQNTGAINRIVGGIIPTNGSVYVEFSYRNSNTNVNIFTTWCRLAASQGTQIRFDLDNTTKKNKLVIDGDFGEGLFINTPEGLINLSNATTTPLLTEGWIQFVVRSKDPVQYTEYKTNLIDQIIQLKDVNKKKIFKQNNSYFDEIVAFREPLQERTLNHLKVNTLKTDHTIFAIDSITDPVYSYIVINFEPTHTSELYNKIPTADSDETNPPVAAPEEFLYTWTSRTESGENPSGIVVKIDLQRAHDGDGALTPKVYSYKLRVGP